MVNGLGKGVVEDGRRFLNFDGRRGGLLGLQLLNGVAAEDYEMYHLRNGLGVPIDPLEIDNLARDSSPKYNDPAIVTKREELAQRLAALEESRLQPLEGPEIFLPFIQM